MILKEFLIDGLAAAEAFLGVVPEAYLVLAQLPAQAYVAVAMAGHEVQKTDVQVLDHGAGLGNLVQSFLEGGNTGIAAGPRGQDFTGIDPGASRRPHAICGAVHILLGFLGFRLVE